MKKPKHLKKKNQDRKHSRLQISRRWKIWSKLWIFMFICKGLSLTVHPMFHCILSAIQEFCWCNTARRTTGPAWRSQRFFLRLSRRCYCSSGQPARQRKPLRPLRALRTLGSWAQSQNGYCLQLFKGTECSYLCGQESRSSEWGGDRSWHGVLSAAETRNSG